MREGPRIEGVLVGRYGVVIAYNRDVGTMRNGRREIRNERVERLYGDAGASCSTIVDPLRQPRLARQDLPYVLLSNDTNDQTRKAGLTTSREERNNRRNVILTQFRY